MPQAVRFNEYGDVDVLQVVDVPRPVPAAGQVLVEVKAAGINLVETAIRTGIFAERLPVAFPSGQGSDLAGVVAEVGEGVTRFVPGDEVLGFSGDRAGHAQLVLVEEANLTPRPSGVSWEVAGSLYMAGTTAYATVRAVSPEPGEVLVVSAAAGGVGSIAVQLAKAAGATVIGLASPANRDWLAGHDVIPVAYGDGVGDRVRHASGGRVDAFIDAFGGGYVDLAINLGVRPHRIDTIVDAAAAEKYGVRTDGNGAAGTADVLAELAALNDKGALDVPIAKIYPLTEVRAAFRELERRHTRGKIVLRP
jgi:NADPH:quinone reductase-like Zn-dependent oxidoreductase